MCIPPPISAGGGAGEPPNKFSKLEEGGLDRSQLEEGVDGKEKVWLFQGVGGCNIYIKDKLKPEIFNDKKSL